MRPRRTVRSRIVATTTVVSALAMAVMILAMVLVLNHLTDHNIQSALDDQVGAVTATLRFSPGGHVRELDGPDGAIDQTSWIFDSNGRDVVAPHAGRSETTIAHSLARVRDRVSFERSDRVYLAMPVTDKTTHRVGAVVVGSVSKQPYEASRTAVVVGGGVLGLLVTVGAAAVAAWTTRRALGQVQAMGALAEDWSEHDLESRFAADGDDEIAHLGDTLNLLLDRVAGAIRREQLLTAELAHELRTPLAAIRGEAEVAQMATTRDPRLARIVELTERMDETIRALLAVARGQQQERSRTEVQAAIARTVAGLPESRVDVHVEPTDLTIAAPIDLAVRALAPLTVNAVEHAASVVRISARATGRLVHVDVTDDGPGLGVDTTDDPFTAGVRGTAGAGTGLGLPLARRVARTLGGDVVITSPTEPTVFTLTLHRF